MNYNETIPNLILLENQVTGGRDFNEMTTFSEIRKLLESNGISYRNIDKYFSKKFHVSIKTIRYFDALKTRGSEVILRKFQNGECRLNVALREAGLLQDLRTIPPTKVHKVDKVKKPPKDTRKTAARRLDDTIHVYQGAEKVLRIIEDLAFQLDLRIKEIKKELNDLY